MQYEFQPVTYLYFFGVVVSVILTVIISKRRPAPGAQAFALFNLVAAWWIFTCIMEFGAVSLSTKMIWAKFQCLGILSSGLLWFFFTLSYTHQNWLKKPRNILLLSAIPVITWVIVLTNEFTGLYWSGVNITYTPFGRIAIYHHGFWFWVSALYQYSLVIAGIVVLVRFNRNKSKLYHQQLAVLILGATAPLMFNLIYIFHIKSLAGLDLTPISLAVSSIFYVWLIFRYHFLDVKKLARDTVLEGIPEGILVLDHESRISDLNAAAEKLIGNTKSRVIGQPLKIIWPELEHIKPTILPLEQKTITAKINGEIRNLDIGLTVMTDQRAKLAGEVLIIRDVTEAKIAEDNLRQSEEKFSKVFHSSPGAVVIATLTGDILKVNHSLLDISGFTESELVGKNIFSSTNWLLSENPRDLEQHLATQEKINNLQVKLTGRSGQVHTLLCSVTRVIIQNETLALISASDITDLNHAQENIQRKIQIEETVTRISSRFVGHFDYQQSITAALGDIGNLCVASRAYLFLINEESNEMSNTHEWCSPGTSPQIHNLQRLSCDIFPWWMAILRRGETINIPRTANLPIEAGAEKDLLSRQGIKSVLVFPVNIKRRLAGFIGLDDVTGASAWSAEDTAVLGTAVEIISSALERLQAEIILENRNAKLSEAEEYQRKLLSSLLNGIITVDAQTHQIVDVNDYTCQLIGAPRDQIIGRLCHQFVCPDEQGQCPATDLQQQITSSEKVLLKADGTQLSVIKSVFSIKRGERDYLIESITDIEPLKHAQSALIESEQRYKNLYEQENRLRTELEKESNTRANFINVLTHELKTPLTPLLTSTKILCEKTADKPESLDNRLACNAAQAAETLNNRLNELLDLAKMSNGTYQFAFEEVDAGNFLKTVNSRYTSEFGQKNISLVSDIKPALPTLKMDSARLEKALSYLLDNAGKSSENGDPVVFRATVDSHHLLIDIEHRGEYLSEEERGRLFEPYHRVEQDRQKFSGLGLGFAITKQIIDAHRGWIRLQSDQDSGNKFRIALPLGEPDPPVKPDNPPDDSSEPHPLT
jgi:PAS domain S-box-containing protein